MEPHRTTAFLQFPTRLWPRLRPCLPAWTALPRIGRDFSGGRTLRRQEPDEWLPPAAEGRRVAENVPSPQPISNRGDWAPKILITSSPAFEGKSQDVAAAPFPTYGRETVGEGPTSPARTFPPSHGRALAPRRVEKVARS